MYDTNCQELCKCVHREWANASVHTRVATVGNLSYIFRDNGLFFNWGECCNRKAKQQDTSESPYIHSPQVQIVIQ